MYAVRGFQTGVYLVGLVPPSRERKRIRPEDHATAFGLDQGLHGYHEQNRNETA